MLVHVPNVDDHYVHAKGYGAKIISAPETQPFGERSYEAADIEGQRWFFSQHVQDVAPEEWGAKVAGTLALQQTLFVDDRFSPQRLRPAYVRGTAGAGFPAAMPDTGVACDRCSRRSSHCTTSST